MRIWINRAGQNVGTFTLEEVQQGLRQGQFVGSDLGWRQGMPAWLPLTSFPDLTVPAPAAEPEPAPEAEGLAKNVPPGDIAPAWEQRRELGFRQAFVQTIRQVLTEPAATFSRMPEGGLDAPTRFYMFVLVLHLVLTTAVELALAPISNIFEKLGLEHGPDLLTLVIAVPLVLMIAFVLLLALNFASAGVYHAILVAFGAARRDFTATYRVVTYSQAASIFNVVPCIGPIAAILFFLISSIIGLQKVHGIDSWKAATAVLLPVLVSLAGYLVLIGWLINSLVRSPG